MIFLSSHLYSKELDCEFVFVLLSVSLADCRSLQGLFWETLYKKARLENQRPEDVGCDYDRMNTGFFPCLKALPAVNRISVFYIVLLPVDVVQVKTESPFYIL